MNFSELSDFEINKAVAELHLNATKTFKGNELDESVTVLGEKVYSNFNPCNNPSHAWPIILQHGICITSPTKGGKNFVWSASWNEGGGRWSSGDIKYADKNPLRAAMIVYLMMQEPAND